MMFYKGDGVRFALLVLTLSLIPGTASCVEHDRGFHQRGDVQWTEWLGTGENHRIPSGTLVPHFRFDGLSVEYEKFVSPRKSLGCELSLSEQIGSGNNNAGAILGDYRNYFFVHGRFAADYAAGIGVMRMCDKISGQATKSNFCERLSVGLHYATGPNNAVSLEYRFYHASNAGIERPNHGINATTAVIGYSWYR